MELLSEMYLPDYESEIVQSVKCSYAKGKVPDSIPAADIYLFIYSLKKRNENSSTLTHLL